MFNDLRLNLVFYIPLILNSINLFYIDFELKKLKISNGLLKNLPGNT